MIPIALCLQVSPVDAEAAIDLADLLASLEAAPRRDVPMVVIHRRDTDAEALEFIHRTLSTKFVHTLMMEAMDFATGFPAGPNALWHSSMTCMALARQQGWINVEGALTFEADCVPMRRNWIDCLIQEWRGRRDDVWAVGHWHGEPGSDGLHLNGNSIFDLDLLQDWPALHGQPSGSPWDYHHRKMFLKISQDTNFITQFYRQPSIEEWQFKRVRKNGVVPALLHGIKNGSARAAARKTLL